MTHICVNNLTIIGSDNGLSPGRAPSHCLNYCWNIVNWTLKNEFQWNCNQNSNIFIQENAFEHVVWKMEKWKILSRLQCVKLVIFNIKDRYLEYFQWNCHQFDASTTRWGLLNIKHQAITRTNNDQVLWHHIFDDIFKCIFLKKCSYFD